MPHKNAVCHNPECYHEKTKFSKWLEDTGEIQSFSDWHIWKFETKCPICGRTYNDWRARRPSLSALKTEESKK